jgi:hypothetical protein
MLSFSINHTQKFKYQLFHLRITTDTLKHKWFQQCRVHFNLSNTSTCAGQFNHSVPEYKVVICSVQFDDIYDSPIKQMQQRIHYSKHFDVQDFKANLA